MKKTLLFFIAISTTALKSQQIVFNDRLLAQLQKNQLVRLASEKGFFKSYEKQKELYNKATKKVAQVVAIQEYIYDKLYNVNSLFRQGKKVKYIYDDIKIISENTSKILQLSTKLPQYQPFLIKEYESIIKESLNLKTFIQDNVLKKDHKSLMDPYDRDELLDEIAIKVYTIRGYTYYIISYLEWAKDTPYLMHIPEIKGYVDLDRMIVSDIIRQYKYL